ncbi:MAG: S8 family serine peptidase [Ignavibacteriae bacterium]|nr:hypothetical protein [Ignavibacteriota bacterium]NOG98400.1 S8 family serine peptidase [Ignavibacteriota bacterium]
MKRFYVLILFVSTIIFVIWAALELNKNTDGYLYGNSLRQNRLVNTIRLHKYGITGERIKVGVLDAGFYAAHSVFADTKILGEYDFVTNKSTTFNKDHIKGVKHGTNVFSVIGGYLENDLIGIAYGASYYLAKSDKSSDRLWEEETLAVRASEWLYENDVDIITTSLSFNKCDNADYYYPHQMDGKTTRITQTADSIVNKGVLYFCSAGNKFESEWRIIEPPADGFNVLAVGAIDKFGKHSFFSSCGPTVDGRIKPDIAAPGEGVWSAKYDPKFETQFGWDHGTSLAAPIAAGVAALVLSTHPNLSQFELMEAIKNSSSKADSPDTLYGYGIPDAEKAVSYFGPAFSNTPIFEIDGNELTIETYVFSSNGVDRSSVEVYLLEGESEKQSSYKMYEIDDDHYACEIELENLDADFSIYFTAKDKRGKLTKYPAGKIGDNFILKIINERAELL